MADDIVTLLANMATDHGRYRTHYEGCHKHHLECAALIVCDEIVRLRAAGDVIACVLASLVGDRADVQRLLDAWEARRD